MVGRIANPSYGVVSTSSYRPALELMEDRVTPAPIGTALYPGDKLYALSIGGPHQWAHPNVVPRLARYQTVVLSAVPAGHDPDTSDGRPTSYAEGIQRIRTAAAAIGNADIRIGLYFEPGSYAPTHPLYTTFLNNG